MNILKISTLALALITLAGCGGQKAATGDGGNVSSRSLSPTRKVVAVVSRTQLLPNYLACTGLPADSVSNDTRNEVNDALGKMAEEGNVNDVSAPMMMAFVKVGAEVCSDLIDYEQGLESRKFFGGFNLNDSTAGQDFNLGRTVRSLASSCWGRAPTDAEVNLVSSNVAQTALADNQGSDLALYACTAILGSSAAVKF